MKKVIVRILIALGAIIAVVLLDTFQAEMFNNNPIIGVREYGDKYLEVKKGIIVSTYTYCNYYKETINNFKRRLMVRRFKGCEGEDAKYLIKSYIIDLAKIIDEDNNYKTSDPYSVLMSFVASPKFIEEMYNDGEFTEKEGYTAAIVIEDITKCNVAKEFDAKWNTADEFFELWEKSNCKTKKKLYKALEKYD